MFAGSFARNLKNTNALNQYHSKCSAPTTEIKHQRLGAMYDLDVFRKGGLQIIDVDEFWKLRKCGLIPEASLYLPGSLANPKSGTCHQCTDNKKGGLATVFDFTNSERIGARNQAICGGGDHIATWHKHAMSDAPVIETCCVRKEAMKKMRVRSNHLAVCVCVCVCVCV